MNESDGIIALVRIITNRPVILFLFISVHPARHFHSYRSTKLPPSLRSTNDPQLTDWTRLLDRKFLRGSPALLSIVPVDSSVEPFVSTRRQRSSCRAPPALENVARNVADACCSFTMTGAGGALPVLSAVVIEETDIAFSCPSRFPLAVPDIVAVDVACLRSSLTTRACS